MQLHLGGGHNNNCQIILKLFGYDIFCNNMQHKNNFKEIWRYKRYYHLCYIQIGGGGLDDVRYRGRSYPLLNNTKIVWI